VSRKGWSLFAALCLIWGMPFLLIKVAVDEVSPQLVVFARTAGGVLVLLPLVLRRGGFRTLRGYWIPMVAFALFEVIAPWLLLSDAERHLTSSMCALLLAVVPVLGVVGARVSGDRRRISWVRWVGLLLGLGGVAVLGGPALGHGKVWPVIEVLLTAAGYATAPIIADRALRGVPSLITSAACLGITALVYLPVVPFSLPAHLPSTKVLLALLVLATVCTALPFILFFDLIGEIGAARATVVTYVNPAVATLLGALLLSEKLTLNMGIAFVMILGGSVLGARQSSPSIDPTDTTANGEGPANRTSAGLVEPTAAR
jgi:drug/metabolite transporter (DMT)-like permease